MTELTKRDMIFISLGFYTAVILLHTGWILKIMSIGVYHE